MVTKDRSKILFISHSYPPSMGGMESQNYNLAQGLARIADVKIIANRMILGASLPHLDLLQELEKTPVDCHGFLVLCAVPREPNILATGISRAPNGKMYKSQLLLCDR